MEAVGHTENGNKKLTCDPCEKDTGRFEVLRSAISYKAKGGYINTNPDVIALSPEAMRIYETPDQSGRVLDVETLRVMPTVKDMMKFHKRMVA